MSMIFISAPLPVSQHRVHDLLFVLIGELIGRYCSDQPEYTPDEQRAGCSPAIIPYQHGTAIDRPT
jgi:hypothetical protein